MPPVSGQRLAFSLSLGLSPFMFSGIHPGTASRRLVCSIIPLLMILTEILRLRLSILVICQVFFLKKFIVFS